MHLEGAPEEQEQAAPPRPPLRRKRAVCAAAAAVFLLGTLASFLGAKAVAREGAEPSVHAFRVSSAEVASALGFEIQHEEDLVTSAGAFVSGLPGATNSQFKAFASAAHVLSRYPEILGFGHSVVVPAGELSAFEAREKHDPPAPLGPGGGYTIVPPGKRPYYCLMVGDVARDAADSFPVGYDFCAGGLRSVVLGARDSGQPRYVPIVKGRDTLLSVVTPIYSGGATPGTVAGRRAAFIGWIGTAVEPRIVLERALAGHPAVAASLSYRAGGPGVVFGVGDRAEGTASVATALPGGWEVRTYGTEMSSAIGSNADALALLAAGIALGASLAALLVLLSAGRARALRLVEEKTGELRHVALHDALTDLPNRALVADRAEQLLLRNRRNGTVAVALYIDLDDFKSVNDTLGHEVGDCLLRALADRLRSRLRDVDTIGRLGGDEFVVLLDGATMLVAPELVAERVVEVARQPFELAGVASPVLATISVGVASGDRPAAHDLLRDADVALYEAKAAGKNRYAVFSDEMDIGLQRRYEIEFELRGALAAGQLHLAYQPIYDLTDLSLVGVEALLRWDHPRLGSVSPVEFVPVLEASGQIVDVGRWVLGEACSQVAGWRQRLGGLGLAVNLSGRQLDEEAVVGHVREALAESGLDASALTLEVTETALMRNIDSTVERLHAFKALGAAISIDDFGTGYSSLAHVQRFPIDYLKIDRTFTASIATSPEADVLIHTLVQLAKNLGARTVAEGIETYTQMACLRDEQVDQAQGFLLARPLGVADFEARFLRQPLGSDLLPSL